MSQILSPLWGQSKKQFRSGREFGSGQHYCSLEVPQRYGHRIAVLPVRCKFFSRYAKKAHLLCRGDPQNLSVSGIRNRIDRAIGADGDIADAVANLAEQAFFADHRIALKF